MTSDYGFECAKLWWFHSNWCAQSMSAFSTSYFPGQAIKGRGLLSLNITLAEIRSISIFFILVGISLHNYILTINFLAYGTVFIFFGAEFPLATHYLDYSWFSCVKRCVHVPRTMTKWRQLFCGFHWNNCKSSLVTWSHFWSNVTNRGSQYGLK